MAKSLPVPHPRNVAPARSVSFADGVCGTRVMEPEEVSAGLVGSHPRTLTRGLVALAGILLVPRTIGEGLIADVLAIGAPLLYLVLPNKLRRALGVLVLATWALAPTAYLPALFAFASVVAASL